MANLKTDIEYLANPNKCIDPACDGETGVGDMKWRGNDIVVDMHCFKCGRLWLEVYKLTGYTEELCQN